MLNQEQATKIIVALMGKCWHEWNETTRVPSSIQIWKCAKCGALTEPQNRKENYNPNDNFWSLCDNQGRMTYEIMDWMKKELPEEWNKYLWDAWDVLNEGRGFLLYQEALDSQLSLANLARYLKEHNEWAWIECEYQNHCSEDPQAPEYCPTQKWSEGNCTGKIINPKYTRVLEMLKEFENGK